MTAKPKKNAKLNSGNPAKKFLIKAVRPSKIKIIMFVVLFAGVTTIALRPSYAYAGYHAWNQPGNRVDWSIAYTLPSGALCGHTATGGGYFLYGPYDNFWVTSPSGMDLTMQSTFNINPSIETAAIARIDISRDNGQKILASVDSPLTSSYGLITGTWLKQDWYSQMEYRIAAIKGDVCIYGYNIYQK